MKRPERPVFAIAILAFLAVLCGFLGKAASGLVPAVEADINRVFRLPAPPESAGMNFIRVDSGPGDFGQGVGLVVFGVLLAGIPGAATAIALFARTRARRHRWPYRWGSLFQAAIVVQGCCLALALTGLLLFLSMDAGAFLVETPGLAVFLIADVIASFVSLSSWRSLQVSVESASTPSVTRSR